MKTICATVASEGQVVLCESEVPDPAPGQVLLEAKFSSLSPGTERSLLAGHILPLPQALGYSLAATVAAVGPGVTRCKVGDAVVATARHAGLQNVDERLITPVPPDVDLEQASFFNLAHTALYGIRRSGLEMGEPALILGQGLVGALAAKLASIAGAAPVVVTDIDDARLAVASRLGAHIAINTQKEPDALASVVNSLGQEGFPAVFEATGARQPLEQAVDVVSERGRVIMLSTVHNGVAPDITEGLMMKGAVLIGGYVNSKPFALARTDLTTTDAWPPTVAAGSSRYAHSDSWTSDEDIRAILNLIRYGALDLSPLVSHRFSIDAIPAAYEMVWNRDPDLLGGVIDWRSLPGGNKGASH